MAVFNGTPGADRFTGSVDNDTFNSISFNDSVDGGGGTDVISIDLSAIALDVVYDAVAAATAGGTTPLAGMSVRNVERLGALATGAGHDSLIVSRFQASFSWTAGAGDDLLVVDYTGDTGGLVTVLEAGRYLVYARTTGLLGEAWAIESVRITGGLARDQLEGTAGNDSLSGGNANDVLTGEAGNDSLEGGAGEDSLHGQEGDDLLVDTSLAYMYGGAGNDTLIGGAQRQVMVGEAGNDSLSGGDDEDFFRGDDGDDILEGGGGADLLIDDDVLTTVVGNDTVLGGAGNDQIASRGGVDLIDGGGRSRLCWAESHEPDYRPGYRPGTGDNRGGDDSGGRYGA